MKRESLVLKGFHPDPSVIRVGKKIYVANSTFEWFPGVEIHETEDFMNWELTGHPLETEEMLPMEGIGNSGGVWAPCLSYDKGIFYLVFSIVRTFDEMTQDNHNYLTMAKDIHGPWSSPVYLNSGGFDASLFHDTDGRKWLLNMIWDETIGRNHFHGIEMQEYDPVQQKLAGPRKNIYRGTERGLTEGPHLYQKDGWYYLLTAEGGTSEGHCVTMARSRNIWGPYESNERGPLLTAHGLQELAIQYAGHGDLVQDTQGNWYLFHLGSRKNMFGGYSVFGRETFMQNVCWEEGEWPRLPHGNIPSETVLIPDILVKCEPKPEDCFFKTYDFSGKTLSPDFMTLRKSMKDSITLTDREGYLRLYGRESLSSRFNQALVAVRIREPEFTMKTSVEFEPFDIRQRAGLVFYYHSANYYYLFLGFDEEKGRFLQLIKRDSQKTEQMLEEPIFLPEGIPVGLRGDFSPQGLEFYYVTGKNEWIKAADKKKCPVTILSDEYANVCKEQGFTGAFAGLCAQDLTGMRTPADFAFLSMEENVNQNSKMPR